MRSYRWMLLFTVLALPSMAQERGLKRVRLSAGGDASLYAHSYALVIGVQAYVHWDRLINPVKDAHEVGSALKLQGFEVTYLDDPDAERLKAELHSFAYGREGQDKEARLVVFFAGHGHTEKVASGHRGFILPRDAPRPEADRIGFMSTAVSMDFIRELAWGMLAKHVLFIFDSCFSGTLLRGTAHPEPITRKTTKKEPASFSLKPGQSTVLQVYFAPEETGDRLGQIRLVDKDAKKLATPIKIQGKGALGN